MVARGRHCCVARPTWLPSVHWTQPPSPVYSTTPRRSSVRSSSTYTWHHLTRYIYFICLRRPFRVNDHSTMTSTFALRHVAYTEVVQEGLTFSAYAVRYFNPKIINRLEARLIQPNIGFTFERVTVFTRSDITPPKVNRFGWSTFLAARDALSSESWRATAKFFSGK